MNGVSLLSLWPSTGLTPASPLPLTKLHMPGVPSPVWKGTVVTYLDLLAALLLAQPKMQLVIFAAKAHFWLTVKFLLTGTSKSFSAIHSCPCEGWCPAELLEVPLCHPSSSSRCLWLAAHPRGVSAPAPVLHQQQTCWCSTLSQSPRLF